MIFLSPFPSLVEIQIAIFFVSFLFFFLLFFLFLLIPFFLFFFFFFFFFMRLFVFVFFTFFIYLFFNFNLIFYPQQRSGQAVVTGFVPLLPPRYVPSFFSRIGFSIPTFQLFILVNAHRFLHTSLVDRAS